ncbi:MAG TPA: PTS system mannose/fructose/sorbose family transporter subunit IID [Nitrospirota bacterium]
MSNGHSSIGTRDLLLVFVRGLLVQASWSFERMQSLGFAYAVEPVLRKLYPDEAEYESRLKLHMTYFNTQPYLASYILGAVVRLEEERASGRNPSADVQGLKTALMAPLGALGDSFFWGSLKPFAAVAAAAFAMTGSWWAPFLFLAMYNSVHVGLRIGVLFSGYRSGGNAVDLVARYRFSAVSRLLKVVSLSALGAILGMLPFWRPELRFTIGAPGLAVSLAGLVLTVLLVAVLRKGGSPVKLMLGLAVGCLVLAYAGVI